MTDDLDSLRRELDELDRRIMTLFGERLGVVARVGRLKAGGEGAIRDPEREREILERIVALGQGSGLDPEHVRRVYREILDHSVRYQQALIASVQSAARGDESSYVVGYQGGEGAFSHMAAMRHFAGRGAEIHFRGFPNFTSMLEAVKLGDVRYALLPIENSIAGSIHESYDLLARMDLHLVGEEIQKVEHCLVALADVPLHQIRRVYSHPVALAQCTRFLGSLENCHAEAYHDTALSVAKVKQDQDLSQAAIASEEAARVHGLPVIRRGIANDPENYTRMVVVARDPVTYDARLPSKTSIILALAHEQGALARVIERLAASGLNLTKIESRPVLGAPWEYLFYVDFEGNAADPRVIEAFDAIRPDTRQLRVLGSYPSRTRREVG